MQHLPVNTAGAEPIGQTIRVQVGSKLRLAPENIRDDNDKNDDITGLAESIASPLGLLKNPLGYVQDDIVWITAGGRRRRALMVLKREKRLPADIRLHGVPVDVFPKALALEISAAEQLAHKPLSASQELRTYKSLSEKGLTAAQIAAFTASTETRVRQLLRLADVAAEVLAAFEAGEMGLDCLQAFTLTDDHDRQVQVWSQLQQYGWFDVGDVRRLLSDGTCSALDRKAVFVGREAYVAAGGCFVTDLFSDAANEVWASAALVEQLAQDKLAVAAEKVRAEGWSDVRIARKDYDYASGFELIDPERREYSDAETAERQRLATIINESDDAFEKAQARSARNEIDQAVKVWTEEERSSGAAFLVLQSGGSLDIVRGYFAKAGAASPTSSNAKCGDEKPRFGHAGHERMTRIATVAVRNAVVQDPAVAYDTLVAHQAWTTLRSSNHSLALPYAGMGADGPEGISIKGDEAYEEAFAAWDERLSLSMTDFFREVMALTAEEKGRLLALCVGAQLNAVEHRADQRRERAWAELGLIAERAGIDMAQTWTPDGEFLKGATKKVLLEVLDGMQVDTAPHRSDKQAALAEIVARNAARSHWIPELLAELPVPSLRQGLNRADRGEGPAAAEPDDRQA